MKKEAMLYKRLPDGSAECFLCSHRCKIADSKYGFCGVRQNLDGRLYTQVYAEAIANHVDPIEKKPLYHFFPGSTAYSIAAAGCNFRCLFCQNWRISQRSKRPGEDSVGHELKPEEVVKQAKRCGCKSIAYTYTEPTIFFEYAYDTARIARSEGLCNSFVTNGYMTREALDTIKPYLDAANVDLKSFKEKTYRDICQAHLEPVLDSIRYMKKLGIWVEVTTLVVPGLNDSDEELEKIAGFIAETGKEIPWHISRFHPDYKYTDSEPTPINLLKKAKEIGRKAGLRYLYLGNVLEDSSTYCYSCQDLVIKRDYLNTLSLRLDDNKCPKCGVVIDGRF